VRAYAPYVLLLRTGFPGLPSRLPGHRRLYILPPLSKPLVSAATV